MGISNRNSRRIEVDRTTYRWRATGSDGDILLTIWPDGKDGSVISGSLWYTDRSGNQIVVTNRLVRQVIELAIREYGYDADRQHPVLEIRRLSEHLDLSDAVRARFNTD